MPITVSIETIKPLILDHMADVIGLVIKLIRTCRFLSGHVTFKLKHCVSQLLLVCYTAAFSVVTQRSFPQTAAENRTTFLSRG